MNRFRLEIPRRELDLDLTLGCGQVFTWWPLGPGQWVGVDGPFAYQLSQGEFGIDVVGTGSVAELSRFFQLDVSLLELEQLILQADPTMQESLSALPGLRILRNHDPVAILFSFLCTSNNHLTRIRSMVDYLVGLGEPLVELGERQLKFFPTLVRLAELTEQELRENGFGYRGAKIPKVAKQLIADGGLEFLQEMQSWPYQEAHQRMLRYPGIGPKLADCFLLFGLGFGEAVPVDTHVWQQAVRRDFPQWAGLARTDARYREIGDLFRSRFGQWSGWAHEYLYYENLLRQKR